MPVPRVGAVGWPEIDALHVEFEQGEADVVRRLIDELPRWFEAHAGMHDAALADYLKQPRTAAAQAP